MREHTTSQGLYIQEATREEMRDIILFLHEAGVEVPFETVAQEVEEDPHSWYLVIEPETRYLLCKTIHDIRRYCLKRLTISIEELLLVFESGDWQ